jgi:hypothetical protein
MSHPSLTDRAMPGWFSRAARNRCASVVTCSVQERAGVCLAVGLGEYGVEDEAVKLFLAPDVTV